MKLAFGCDPNASELKEILMAKATELGHEVADLGSDDPIYANVAFDVATAVAGGEYDRGILVCGTGIGVSIAANKVEGAYCACIHDVYQAERAVLSNNANLIAMGSQVIGTKLAEKLLEEYLKYTYDPNSRSKDKVNRICEFERQ
ncbi:MULTISPECIES: RpiB/LacA/LacB family sugar-phosphate isomerase [Trueperella]|uniref:Ribose-5-phosphate isomerase B n=1 Tax=Trueperella bernardiae TaxID=59561 RepID=A0A0W1KJM6_9ACTO|nr:MULTISPECIES: RpiB/LacA/LacB family sugar-phosphate isomerase [Trueperella]KTF04212.1 Ribose-5-phosphate isomerase B [Trueperella bernardiae]MCM3907971.1 RpiB/LacA/LacB family sugar-phosphate isomerase [Trueperella bernardiae]MDK8601669.1 RpiB/LacA/LacB family sugar-phosphate isomerase [Trueperella bernardiae]MDV6239746.1 RpiB/LacA/LacB family sugar-phosphate isomerase [Trueperella bernardiae]OCW60656.1 sugar phosphate isomerase [Trueperella bernardiae]